ncbi:sulfatase [uncultured Gimesia sp.]|uniref:sulfatase family protein n=1 Tax=uncultured Gimesia sp. TaxID=1678688 RepID=UPI0030DCE1DC|tara:strand:+ start:17382 stop:18800 length:1419 start_codon:yes stop_codon:yes gene_type:complete
MPKRSRGQICLLLLLLLCAPVVKAEVQPNFVFIIADDMTFRDIGCYGGQAHTPHIDHLATEGMKFTQCFQAAPMCSPTRHNIYTGLYPVKSGAYPNHTFAKPGTQSIAHYLKPLGYRVALSGKKHISPKTVFPFEYSGKKNNPDMAVIDQLFANSSSSNSPFCLFACSNEPHSPWNKGDASRYPPAKIKLPSYIVDTPLVRDYFSRYLAEITYFDDQVGQILRLLDKHHLSQNTMVMVVSEQGNGFPFAKWTCYGNGLQSAMIVRWPGKVKPASTTDAMVEYVDIAPTFVDAAGGDLDPALDGTSFLPVLKGKTNHHKNFTYGIMTTRGIINGSDQYAIRTVRDKQYRLIWNLNYNAEFSNICMNTDYYRSMVQAGKAGDAKAKSLVEKYKTRPEFELYDCDADPLEMNNLAEDLKYKEVKQRLNQRLKTWMKEQGDQGIETERDAILRQGKFKGLTRREAMKRFRIKGRKK